jgi:hypothetical protein
MLTTAHQAHANDSINNWKRQGLSEFNNGSQRQHAQARRQLWIVILHPTMNTHDLIIAQELMEPPKSNLLFQSKCQLTCGSDNTIVNTMPG